MKNSIIKKIAFVIFFTFSYSFLCFGQAPEIFKYQAVLRDAGGNILANQSKTVVIDILKTTPSGTSVFTESHSVTTTAQGVINLNIGSVQSLAGIDWSVDMYFVRITVDGTEMGTSQLLSVPYALQAKKVEEVEYSEIGNTPDLSNFIVTETDPTFTAWDKDYYDFTNLPTLFNGNYNSLMNLPVLFDGEWSSLTNTPTTLSGYGISDAFDGNYNSLTNLPVLFSGSYTDLSNTPDLTVFAAKNMNGENITNLANPVNAQDLATKTYVDFLQNTISGFNTTIETLLTRIEELENDAYSIPTILTTNVSNIQQNNVTAGGNVTYSGNLPVTNRGVVYSTSENPTIENNEGMTSNGSGLGEFTSVLDNLTAATTYYVRAYATNSEGTAYGEQISFSTLAVYVLNDNVIFINDDQYVTLISTEAELEQGIYIFKYTGAIPEFPIDNIIVSNFNEGFLRKITYSNIVGNIVTLHTEQATIEDMLQEGDINLNLSWSDEEDTKNSNIFLADSKVNYAADGVVQKGNGLTFDFSNTVIYQNELITFQISQGAVTFDPNFHFNVNVQNSDIQKISFGTDSADLNIDVNFNLNANASTQIVDFSKDLVSVSKAFFIIEPPIVVVLEGKLVANLGVEVEADMNIDAGFTQNYLTTINTVYQNNAWQSSYEVVPTFTANPVEFSQNIKKKKKMSLVPEVSVKLYGIVGPYWSLELWEEFDLNTASPSLDWDASLKAGLTNNVGVKAEIFDITLFDFSFSKDLKVINSCNAPDTIIKISGDNQTALEGTQLPEPIVVKVTDTLNNALANVNVHFIKNNENGEETEEIVTTNNEGIAQYFWTLGNYNYWTQVQKLEVIVYKANGNMIDSTSFHATAIDYCETLSESDYYSWWSTLDDESKKGYNKMVGNELVTTILTLEEFRSLCNTEYIGLQGCNISQLNGLSFLKNMTDLTISDSQLTSLDVSECTNLQDLSCDDNQLTSLDVSTCTNLQKLGCPFNLLASLDVSGLTKLQELYCSENIQLTSLNASGCTNLEYIDCYRSQLTSLNASGCTNLEYIDCEINQLTILDISGCTNLQTMYLYSNQLTSLNVSGFTNLRHLYCEANQLTSLDISGCTNLIDLLCEGNQLTSLDISGCTNLNKLWCYANPFSYSELQKIISWHIPNLWWDCGITSPSYYANPDDPCNGDINHPCTGSECWYLNEYYYSIYGTYYYSTW